MVAPAPTSSGARRWATLPLRLYGRSSADYPTSSTETSSPTPPRLTLASGRRHDIGANHGWFGQTLVVGGRDPKVGVAAVLSGAALVTVVQIPPVSRFFGCRPLGPVALAIAGTVSLGAIVVAVATGDLTGQPTAT